jgi:hypothetical protein
MEMEIEGICVTEECKWKTENWSGTSENVFPDNETVKESVDSRDVKLNECEIVNFV